MTVNPAQTPCPCKDCTDRCAEPNCHGETGHCPHGYLEWKKLQDERKEKALNERRAEVMVTSNKIEILGKVAKRMRSSWRR